jgi:hypothetical protein
MELTLDGNSSPPLPAAAVDVVDAADSADPDLL